MGTPCCGMRLPAVDLAQPFTSDLYYCKVIGACHRSLPLHTVFHKLPGLITPAETMSRDTPLMHFCCSSETAWQTQLPCTPEGSCNPSLPTHTSVSRVPLGIHLVCETPLQQPGNQKGTVPICRPLPTGLTQRGASLKTSVGTFGEEAR